MSPRERLRAAFYRQPCDFVPYAPHMDGYFFTSLDQEMQSKSGWDVQYELSGHILARIPIVRSTCAILLVGDALAPTDAPANVKHDTTIDGVKIVHTIETPVGSLRAEGHFAPESPTMPWIDRFRIQTVEDVKTFQYILERTEYKPVYKLFGLSENFVGDRGLTVVAGPPSPLAHMICQDMGMEAIAYMLADYPREMNEMLEVFHEKQKEMWRLMAESPADVFILTDNLSTTTTSRAQYREYYRRHVDDYADIVHAAGKKLLNHWCGRLTGFAPDIASARHDGITDITPLPTGDVDIVEARKTWAKNFVIVGGIDCTLYANGTAAEVEAYVEDLLGRMEPDRRGFILGSGDAVPYGTPPENLRIAGQVAARFPVD